MKRVAIIQTRMGSTRLPGKVMLDLCGKTVLSHVIERVRKSKCIDEIVIATTTDEVDDVVVQEALKCGTKVFRGSEYNVLERYYLAAQENNANIIIRITSDCPLIDSQVIDDVVAFYETHRYDVVSNAGDGVGQRTYPRGLDVEVFSMNQLEKAYNNANKEYQLEHVTPFIYEEANRIYYYKGNKNYSYHRWTLDTKEDYELIKRIYEGLYDEEHKFALDDIIMFFEENPEIYEINSGILQKHV